MNSDIALQILGYTASVLVTVSLMMRSIVRLRWLSLAGGVIFTVYGVLIEAYPVAALNLAVVAINVYHLHKMRRAHEEFSVIEMAPGDAYVQQFLDFHRRDIERNQPSGLSPHAADTRVLVVMRDMVPAGVLMVGSPDADGSAEILLDYVTPAYRDLQIGRYLFRTNPEHLRDRGYRALAATATSEEHRRYLGAIGFVPSDGGYHLTLPTGATAQVR